MSRSIFIILILIVFASPLIQKYAPFATPDYKLEGYNAASAHPIFSWKDFFEGTYQEQLATYLQENVGYKGYLIALKNQIDYSLFNKLNYGIEKGDDGQLFYWNHIDVHCGHLTLSKDSFQRKIDECIALKLVLDSLHTKILFVLAPGKPYFYQDKLPEKFKTNCNKDNDYHHVRSLLQQNNFDVIDFNEWFKQERTSSAYPLFPKLGTHWSYYGATLANDSLAKFIEKSLQTKLNDYTIINTNITNLPEGTDKDLWGLLNVILPIKSDSLAYPEVEFEITDSTHKKPKLLLIGDSFNWTLLETKMLPKLFSEDSRFWFYKRQLYDLNGKWITDNADEVNLHELLKGTDIVVFLSTEVLYHRVDHGLANAVLSNQSVIDSLTQKR